MTCILFVARNPHPPKATRIATAAVSWPANHLLVAPRVASSGPVFLLVRYLELGLSSRSDVSGTREKRVWYTKLSDAEKTAVSRGHTTGDGLRVSTPFAIHAAQRNFVAPRITKTMSLGVLRETISRGRPSSSLHNTGSPLAALSSAHQRTPVRARQTGFDPTLWASAHGGHPFERGIRRFLGQSGSQVMP